MGEIEPEAIAASEQTLAPRKVKLTTRTGIEIARLIPHRTIKTIGAWCFLDYFGPTNQEEAMNVAPHPHTGLQTVSWLFSGEVEHKDSIGNAARISPGQLNLMTAGIGIAHSEFSLNRETDLHGLQFWIVLPNEFRNMLPEFSHHDDLPIFDLENFRIQVIFGDFLNHRSTAIIYSQIIGAEILAQQSGISSLPLNPEFEYGILSVTSGITVNGSSIPNGYLHYIPTGATAVEIEAAAGARCVIIGGVPFDEEIIMWWNFIGRSHEEIVEMRSAWQNDSSRFGKMDSLPGEPIPAPQMPNLRLVSRSNFSK